MKQGTRVMWPAKGLHGTIDRVIGPDSPMPYAWVDFDDGSYEDIELRNLREEKFGPCDACGRNACLIDECICPACKSKGKGKEGDLSPKKEES